MIRLEIGATEAICCFDDFAHRTVGRRVAVPGVPVAVVGGAIDALLDLLQHIIAGEVGAAAFDQDLLDLCAFLLLEVVLGEFRTEPMVRPVEQSASVGLPTA